MAEVTVTWSQTDTFRSTVDIDLEAVLAWLQEGTEKGKGVVSLMTVEDITAEQIQEFWEASGEEEWWDPDKDYDADWQATNDRTLEEVTL